MKKGWGIVVWLVLLLAGLLASPLADMTTVFAQEDRPVVRFTLFYSQTCPHCHELMENYMPTLYDKYGDQIEHRDIDIYQNEQAYLAMLALEQRLGVPEDMQGYVPTVIIGDKVLVGVDPVDGIPGKLEGYINEYLAQGGVDYTSLENDTLVRTPEPAGKPIYLAYFEKAGCQECARTTYDLDVVKAQYPQVVVESFAIEQADNKALNEWLSEQYGVPEEKRLLTPMIFVGSDVLIDTEATLEPLLAAVDKYAATGAERTWQDYDPEAGREGILDRFKNLKVLGVLGAGLIDGLNPCAFATLVFFISYMAFSGRRGRDILFVGLAFAVGVFLTYLLVGVGLFALIQSLDFFTSLGRWVYLLTALLCITLAMLTFRDYRRARQGHASEMSLKLPTRLRRRINQVVREGAQVRAFVAMAFVTGFLVSLIELACTGQVYLPTIVYVLSEPELASQAFLYLLLYCLMFVVPLVVVFVLAYLGTTSEQLGQFVNRHVAAIKLATGVLFVGLALWMTWTLAPLFGIQSPWNWVALAVVVAVIVAGAILLERTGRRRHVPAKKAPARKSRA